MVSSMSVGILKSCWQDVINKTTATIVKLRRKERRAGDSELKLLTRKNEQKMETIKAQTFPIKSTRLKRTLQKLIIT